MENALFQAHASVLSQSPLSAYITGPAPTPSLTKSSFNPYRKSVGLFSLFNLKRAEEALAAAVEKKDQEIEPVSSETPLLAMPTSALPSS